MKFLPLLLALFLSACASVPADKKQPLDLKPSSFETLQGWAEEDFKGLAEAYGKSCARILKKDARASFGPDQRFGLYQDWQPACRVFLAMNDVSAADLKDFFETYFQPYHVLAGKDPEGLFTGYYEASLKGAPEKGGKYQYPLRARPEDLVMVDLGLFREELKGQRIAGRVVEGNLKPYERHTEIVAGKLPAAQDKKLVWVDSPVDAFFVQIQGSGVVVFEDGSRMRIGYAGQNGHPYYAIGRELVKRGALEKENVSMQSIRDWLESHPSQAGEIMTTNASYVFFRELPDDKGSDGPQGGEGVTLTGGRSLAVDHSLIPYGVPVWLDAGEEEKIRRLMVAQDTGGAIRGPVRGDVFWGYGADAERLAGNMKAKGQYWFLLPRKVKIMP